MFRTAFFMLAATADNTTTYLYRRVDNGDLVKVEMTFGELLERQQYGFIVLDDGLVAKRVIKEQPQPPAFQRKGIARWPLYSQAAGCLPKQVKSFREQAQKEGLTGVDFCPKTGDAIFESKGQRRKYLEARGFFDRNGGYSDPQPR
jgi:hypothetical protein